MLHPRNRITAKPPQVMSVSRVRGCAGRVELPAFLEILTELPCYGEVLSGFAVTRIESNNTGRPRKEDLSVSRLCGFAIGTKTVENAGWVELLDLERPNATLATALSPVS